MPPHILYAPFLSFSSVWDYVPTELFLCKTRGGKRRVGSEAYQRVHVNLMDLGPLDHQLNTCLNRDSSDIERSAFNRAIVRSWDDTWTRLDATMEIRRRNLRDHEIVAHDRRVIVAHDHCAIVVINRLHRIKRPVFLARKSL